jgi:predicted small lipoprotein YifL
MDMNRRTLLKALVAALAAAPLAACGRRGSLVPPDGGTYPGHYPRTGYPNDKPKTDPAEEPE